MDSKVVEREGCVAYSGSVAAWEALSRLAT
jgi:hypothetical protein